MGGKASRSVEQQAASQDAISVLKDLVQIFLSFRELFDRSRSEVVHVLIDREFTKLRSTVERLETLIMKLDLVIDFPLVEGSQKLMGAARLYLANKATFVDTFYAVKIQVIYLHRNGVLALTAEQCRIWYN